MTAVPLAKKSAVAIRHIQFADLGLFEPVLMVAGYSVTQLNLKGDGVSTLDALKPYLLIILGGPVGIYEYKTYPWLVEKRRILAAQRATDHLTLGICLDAQQIAATLGATVAPMVHKEIRFGTISLTDAEWSRKSWNDRIAHHPRLLHWSEHTSADISS